VSDKHSSIKQPPVICLMGPTASGKTALAMALCDALPCDIVSVDSALIYRDMDIGTAKPTEEELAKYPHRLINLRDATQSYSAADFCHDALAEIEKIRANNRIPLLVGGTMMYFKSLIEGISPLPAANSDIRQQIEAEAEQSGWQAMHEKLQNVDSVSAERIHPNTPKERSTLHARIELRYQQMIEQGFEQEVINLKKRDDLNENLPSIRCVGYRQMWQYLNGEFDHKEMVFRGVCATRQLAKRQLTWLRSWQNLHWLTTDDKTNLAQVLALIGK